MHPGTSARCSLVSRSALIGLRPPAGSLHQ
jgi:hypothetical protein